MGYRSEVQLMLGLGAYEYLLDRATDEGIYDTMFDGVNSTSSYIKDDRAMIVWSDVKWYNTYNDVMIIESILSELTHNVEQGEFDIETHFFKKIEIGEDNATTVDTNDWDEDFTGEFYTYTDVCDEYSYRSKRLPEIPIVNAKWSREDKILELTKRILIS